MVPHPPSLAMVYRGPGRPSSAGAISSRRVGPVMVCVKVYVFNGSAPAGLTESALSAQVTVASVEPMTASLLVRTNAPPWYTG